MPNLIVVVDGQDAIIPQQWTLVLVLELELRWSLSRGDRERPAFRDVIIHFLFDAKERRPRG